MSEDTASYIAKHRSRLTKHYQNLGNYLVYRFYSSRADDFDLEIMEILKRKIEKTLKFNNN